MNKDTPIGLAMRPPLKQRIKWALRNTYFNVKWGIEAGIGFCLVLIICKYFNIL